MTANISSKVLLIADTQTKAQIEQLIGTTGYDISNISNKDNQNLRQLLHSPNHWDVIICQYDTDPFFGINTLLIAKHLSPNTAFVFFSKVYGEDKAVEAIKGGALDFLAPTNWGSLPHTVTQVLPTHKLFPNHIVTPHTQDYLTGMLSRTEFNRRLSEILSSAAKDEESVLCHVDIVAFDVVNETCGHEAGDELLKNIACIIQSHLRKADITARLGDDEFGVIMVKCQRDEALSTANKIIDSVEKFRFEWDSHVFQVGVCIGVEPFTPAHNLSVLLREVKQACFSAKQKGRNHVQIYHADDDDLKKHDEEIKWVSIIPKALEQNRFVLYFQPIVSLHGEDCYHGEILVRMLDNQGKILPPAQFIPAAEHYGLMIDVDKCVVEKTIEFYRHYHIFYSTQPNLKKLFFSVNLSSLSLRDGAFLDFLLMKLNDIEPLPHKICFEITETSAISDAGYALYFIKMLKLSGCEIALDDFGSGFASFNYLKSLEVDYVKIDGSFIKDIAHDPMDLAIVEAIVHLCKSTGLKTIAEFVENQEIVDILKHFGVDYGQGYHFSKPFPLPNLSANNVDLSVLDFNPEPTK